jgi:hypothetical protein
MPRSWRRCSSRCGLRSGNESEIDGYHFDPGLVQPLPYFRCFVAQWLWACPAKTQGSPPVISFSKQILSPVRLWDELAVGLATLSHADRYRPDIVGGLL